MEERAVIDRVEDGELAVLLVGQEQRELVVPVSQLPDGARAGVWLVIETQDDRLVSAALDPGAEAEARERISEKMRRLRSRGRRRS